MYSVALLVLALAASASAFAPISAPARHTTVVQAVEDELGAIPPLGFWDPLGFSADGDMEAFTRRRAVEIKHGRICMLACIGYWVPQNWKIAGYLSPGQDIKFDDVPNGIAAIGKVPTAGWAQVLLVGGIIELVAWPASDYSADFGTGYFGKELEGEELADKLNKELSNGRLAMCGWIGLAVGDGIAPGTAGLPVIDGIGVRFSPALRSPFHLSHPHPPSPSLQAF